ncbi:hypothetical protein N7497_011241 [Penicillium chrysogenum]|nr:hypothetical protein N7497_011241 [Penicillium chrysogenum]
MINNYRTRLLYTIEQTSSIYLSDAYQEGYLVLNQNREATLNLLRTSYKHSGATDNRGNEDAQTSHLREIILDASARRHIAYKIYLRVTAAKRLSAADEKAGYWLNEDPTLESIIFWVRLGITKQN